MNRHILETFHVEQTNLYFRRYSDGSVEVGTEVDKTFTVAGIIPAADWDILVKSLEIEVGAPAAIQELKSKRRRRT